MIMLGAYPITKNGKYAKNFDNTSNFRNAKFSKISSKSSKNGAENRFLEPKRPAKYGGGENN